MKDIDSHRINLLFKYGLLIPAIQFANSIKMTGGTSIEEVNNNLKLGALERNKFLAGLKVNPTLMKQFTENKKMPNRTIFEQDKQLIDNIYNISKQPMSYSQQPMSYSQQPMYQQSLSSSIQSQQQPHPMQQVSLSPQIQQQPQSMQQVSLSPPIQQQSILQPQMQQQFYQTQYNPNQFQNYSYNPTSSIPVARNMIDTDLKSQKVPVIFLTQGQNYNQPPFI